MDRTTLPKVDKADTSSVEDPMAQALVARLGGKAPNDAPVDDDPNLLNFFTAVSWIGCQKSFLPQKYCPDPGKPDGPVFVTPDADLAISVFSNEDVDGDFRTRLWLASLVVLPSANF
jgi:hypothetical protein